MGFAHFPPLDNVAADRLRAATIAWSELLGELSAVGLRPYLELEQGDAHDALRLYCDLDDGLLVDLSIDDEAFPGAPAARDGDWVVFVEGHDGGYRAEVTIPGDISFAQLACRLVDLTDAVALASIRFCRTGDTGLAGLLPDVFVARSSHAAAPQIARSVSLAAASAKLCSRWP